MNYILNALNLVILIFSQGLFCIGHSLNLDSICVFTLFSTIIQKQPPEVLCKKIKRPKGLQTLKKKTPTQVFSCEICRSFKKTYFEEHL